MPRQSAPTDLAGAAVATYATKNWGVALASSAAAISGTINSGGVRRLRLNTLFLIWRW